MLTGLYTVIQLTNERESKSSTRYFVCQLIWMMEEGSGEVCWILGRIPMLSIFQVAQH